MLDHVFFPNSGVISIVAVYTDGNVVEMATIGREGCAGGMQAFFGARRSSARLLVQIPGSAAKMSRAAFDRAMKSMPSFRNLMSAHVQAFLEQVNWRIQQRTRTPDGKGNVVEFIAKRRR